MNNRIITISREFGSGGKTIGREAASKLSTPAAMRNRSKGSRRKALCFRSAFFHARLQKGDDRVAANNGVALINSGAELNGVKRVTCVHMSRMVKHPSLLSGLF